MNNSLRKAHIFKNSFLYSKIKMKLRLKESYLSPSKIHCNANNLLNTA